MTEKKDGRFWEIDMSLEKHFEEFEKYVNSFTWDIFRIFNIQPFLATVKIPFENDCVYTENFHLKLLA